MRVHVTGLTLQLVGSVHDEIQPTRPPTFNRWAPPTTAPAGWYPNPVGPGVAYFDGRRWRPTTGFVPAIVRRPEPHATLPLVAGMALFAIVAASIIVEQVVAHLVADRINTFATSLVALSALVVVGYGPGLVWVGYVRRRWGDGTWASVGWRWRWRDLGTGLLAGFVALVVEIITANMIVQFDIPSRSNLEFNGGGTEPTTAGRIILVILVVAIAPTAEELMFRGVLMRSLMSKMAPVLAIGLQGVMFGLIHFDPSFGWGNVGLILILSAAGAVFGGATYLTRGIGTAVVAHAMFNGIAIAVLFLR